MSDCGHDQSIGADDAGSGCDDERVPVTAVHDALRQAQGGPTMIIGRTSTSCSDCRANVLGFSPTCPGCGQQFVAKTTYYTGMDIASIRPELPWRNTCNLCGKPIGHISPCGDCWKGGGD